MAATYLPTHPPTHPPHQLPHPHRTHIPSSCPSPAPAARPPSCPRFLWNLSLLPSRLMPLLMLEGLNTWKASPSDALSLVEALLSMGAQDRRYCRCSSFCSSSCCWWGCCCWLLLLLLLSRQLLLLLLLLLLLSRQLLLLLLLLLPLPLPLLPLRAMRQQMVHCTLQLRLPLPVATLTPAANCVASPAFVRLLLCTNPQDVRPTRFLSRAPGLPACNAYIIIHTPMSKPQAPSAAFGYAMHCKDMLS